MKTVLVVDDNDLNRFIAAQVLHARGFAVLQASGGADALSKIVPHVPDVVVLDIQMPGMSGFEVIGRIRSSPDEAVSRIPILAATALAMAEDRERCLRTGANRFLSRPFSMKDLVEQVRALTAEGASPGSGTGRRQASARVTIVGSGT